PRHPAQWNGRPASRRGQPGRRLWLAAYFGPGHRAPGCGQGRNVHCRWRAKPRDGKRRLQSRLPVRPAAATNSKQSLVQVGGGPPRVPWHPERSEGSHCTATRTLRPSATRFLAVGSKAYPADSAESAMSSRAQRGISLHGHTNASAKRNEIPRRCLEGIPAGLRREFHVILSAARDLIARPHERLGRAQRDSSPFARNDISGGLAPSHIASPASSPCSSVAARQGDTRAALLEPSSQQHSPLV